MESETPLSIGNEEGEKNYQEIDREWLKSSQKWAAGSPVPIMQHLIRASRLVTQKLEVENKLNTSQIRVLFEALHPNGVSQAFLSKQHKVDPASVTRTVQTMERDGLITRRPDATDNRYMRVYITPKGKEMIAGVPPILARFEQELVEGWTDDEIRQLHALLDKIEERMGLPQQLQQYYEERDGI
jgi:DNA-binding MarR family transcriptional regulator